MKTLKVSIYEISLLLIMLSLNSSCSLARSLKPPPRLADRTLRICPDKAALCYNYKKTVCKHPRRLVFKDCKDVWVREVYDLNDEKVREKLNHMEFVVQSKMRFKY